MPTPESLRLTILNCVMRSLPDATQVLHQKAHLKPDPKTSIPQLCPFHLHSRTFKIVLSLNKRSNKLSFVLATGCFDGTCREPAFDKGNGAHQVECIPGGHVPGPTCKGGSQQWLLQKPGSAGVQCLPQGHSNSWQRAGEEDAGFRAQLPGLLRRRAWPSSASAAAA